MMRFVHTFFVESLIELSILLYLVTPPVYISERVKACPKEHEKGSLHVTTYMVY